MDKRKFLGGSIPISIGLAGCLFSGSTPTGSEDASTATTNDSRREPREESIYIENLTDTEVIANIRVERQSDDEEVLANTYEVPTSIGLEIPDVGEDGTRYFVSASSNGMTNERDWRVLSCERTDGTPIPSDSTDLGIELTDEDLHMATNDCDAVSTGQNTYTHHEDHKKDGS